MATYETHFELNMQSEMQINKAIKLFEEATKTSKEGKNIVEQFSAFLNELKNNINKNILLLSGCLELSQYAFEVLFPDWFKAIAKEFPDSDFTAKAVQESYTDGSSIEYKVTYKESALNIQQKLKGYIGVEPIYEGTLSLSELNNFIFELNEIKEHKELKLKEKQVKSGLTVKNGVLKSYVGNLTEFDVPDEITAISSKAFSKCPNLRSIAISANVVKIANDAFIGCKNLEKITVSDENSMFFSINNCIIKRSNKKLILGCKTSKIPTDGSIKSISANAFLAGQPKSVFIPNSVTKIEDDAFSCIGLKEIVVEEGNRVYRGVGNCLIETKSKVLLLGCENSVIPDDGSVIEISNHAFGGCNIAEVVIPDSVKNLGSDSYNGDVFKDCSRLETVVIGNGVTSIGWYAFEGCSRLKNVTIGQNVTSVGWCAFEGCKSLVNIEIPTNVTIIESDVFNKCSNLENITLPDELNELNGGEWFTNCKKLNFSEYDNALYLGNKNNPYIVLIKAKDKSIKSCIINDRTKIVVDEAFKGCTSLSAVIFSNSIKRIGCSAFENCKELTNIRIPDSVESIEPDTFKGCKNLSNIILGNAIKSICGHAFAGCISLVSINLPDSLTDIYANAFDGCIGLSNIYISGNVKSIGYDAFNGCDNLTIYCEPESKPANWDGINENLFLGNNYHVVWGYKRN